MTAHAQPRFFLDPRLIYGLDGCVSSVMGLALIVWAAPLTTLAGWTLPATFLLTIGVLLLPWAAYNLWIARSRPSALAVRANIGGDIAWVAGSALLFLIEAPSLTAMGMVLLAAQGIAVAGVLLAKLVGARQLLG